MPTRVSDDELLANLKANLKALIEGQGICEKALSVKAGFARETDVFDILKGRLSASMGDVMSLAMALGVPVDVLLRNPNAHLAKEFDAIPVGEVSQHSARMVAEVFRATERTLSRMSNRPTLDSIITWWKETSGDLSQSDRLKPHFDLVEKADALSKLPRVHHVGALGLSATTLGSPETGRLEKFIESLSHSDRSELNMQIQSVSQKGVGLITPLKRIVSFPEANEVVEVSFVRLMLPVKGPSGDQFVLNYSTHLSETG